MFVRHSRLSRRPRISSRLAIATAAGLGMAAAGREAAADTYTWASPNNPDNWSTGFSPSSPPPSSFNTQLQFNSGSYTAYDDLSDPSGVYSLNAINVNGGTADTINLTVNSGAGGAGPSPILFGGTNSGLFVNGGTVNFGVQANLSAGSQIVNAGANTLTLSGGIAFASNASSSIINSGGGTLVLADAVPYSGTNATINLGSTNGGNILIGNMGPLTISGFTLTTGVTGTLNVTGGTVAFAGNTGGDLFTNGLILNVASGASFDFAGNAESMGGISGSGNVLLTSASVNFFAPGNRSFNGTFSGTGGVTQSAGAVFTLGGTNTYAGTTTASVGTIRATAPNAFSPNSVVSVTALTGALDTGGFSQTIAGLSGGAFTDVLSTAAGNTLTINPAAGTSYVYRGNVTGPGNLTVSGTGTQTIYGATGMTGVVNVSSGALRETASALSTASSILIGTSGTLDVASNTDATLAAPLSGGGSLAKEGSGVVTIANANPSLSLTALTIAGGGLVLGPASGTASQVGTPSLTVTGNGLLSVVGGSGATFSQTFTGTTLNGSLELNASAGSGGTTVVAVGGLTRANQSGGTIDFNPVNAGASFTTATANNAATGTIGGYATYAGTSWATVGTGGVVAPLAAYNASAFGTAFHTDVTTSFAPASSAGTLDLRFNTPSALTLTLAGTSKLTDGGILVTPAVGANMSTITGGTLSAAANVDLIVHQYDTQGGLTISSAIGNTAGTATTATGSITNASTGITVSSTAGLFVGENVSGTNIASGSHITAINATTNVVTLSNAATNTASGLTITFTPGTNLVKDGPGTLTLTRTNSYAGATYINGGTLALSGTVATTYLGVAQDPIYFNGGTLSFTAGNLGTVTQANHPITVGPGGAVFDFGSAQSIQGVGLTGTGPIVKTGVGTLNVGSNGSTFSGTLTVNAGVLAETSSQLGSANGLTINNGGQFQVNDDGAATFGFAAGTPITLNGAGPAGYADPGALALTVQGPDGNVTSTISNAVVLASDSTIGAYSTATASAAPVAYTATLILPSPVSGPGALTVAGIRSTAGTGGIVRLSSASNTYAGGTTVASGTLQLGVTNAVPAGSTLVLGAGNTAGTLDLAGFGQSLSSLTTGGSATGNAVINSGTVAGGSTLSLTTAAGTAQTFAGQIGGGTVAAPTNASINLVKSGAGTYTLSGTNPFTGSVNVAGGSLRLSTGPTANAARAYSVADGANLIVSQSDPTTALSATTLMVGTAAGGTLSFELNGGPPAAGSAGALAVTSGNGLTLNGPLNVSVASGTPLGTGEFPLVTYSGAIGGTGFTAGSLTLPSRVVGQLVNSGNSIDLDVTGVDFLKYTGAVNNGWDINTTANFALNSSGGATTYLDLPSPDTVVFDDTATGLHDVNLTTALHPASVTVTTATGYSFNGSGSLAGTTGLTKNGTGTLVLLTSNTYAGQTAINGGTVQVGNGGTTGTLGAGAVIDNGTLAINRSDAVSVTNGITGTGSIGSLGVGNLTLAGTVNVGGNVTGGAGLFTVGGATTVGGNLTGGAGGLTVAGNANVAGNLTGGAGALAVTGTAVVGGAVTAPGAINVSGGTLRVNGSIGADVALSNAGNLTFNNPSGVTDANAITGAGSLAVASGAVKLTGSVAYTGTTSIGANSLEYASASNISLGAAVSGTGTLIKSGAGLLTMLASNTGFTGTVIVNGGTIQLDDLGASGDLNATSIVINSGGSFIFGPDGNPDFPETTYVTINAGGTFQLGQGENYGGDILNGGTFLLGNNSSGANNNSDGTQGYNFTSGTVASTGTGTSTLNTASAGTALDKYTAGTVIFTGAATIAGGVNINVHQGVLAFPAADFPASAANASNGFVTLGDNGTTGTMRVTDGGAATSSRPFVLQGNGGTIDLPVAGASLSLSNSVSGSAGLTLTGLGTLKLSGSNSYGGGTTINGGTLRANATMATGSQTTVVNAGGTLGGNGSVGAVVVNSGGSIGAGPDAATTGTLNAGQQTWNSGGGLVAKTDGTTADRLIVTGFTVAPPTDGSFTVSFTAANASGGATVAPGTQFVIATDTGDTGTSNPFNSTPAALAKAFTLNVASNVSVAGGGSFQLDSQADAGGGFDLLVDAVSTAAPEPTSLLLAGMAIAPLTLGRRRRATAGR
jgi:autotransporter-associated beta strand protein